MNISDYIKEEKSKLNKLIEVSEIFSDLNIWIGYDGCNDLMTKIINNELLTYDISSDYRGKILLEIYYLINDKIIYFVSSFDEAYHRQQIPLANVSDPAGNKPLVYLYDIYDRLFSLGISHKHICDIYLYIERNFTVTDREDLSPKLKKLLPFI